MTRTPDLETRFGWFSVAAVVIFGALLASGLLLHVLMPGSAASRRLLEAGLVALMLAPAVRITVAMAERGRQGDWKFVLMTVIVIVELLIVMWRAAEKLT